MIMVQTRTTCPLCISPLSSEVTEQLHEVIFKVESFYQLNTVQPVASFLRSANIHISKIVNIGNQNMGQGIRGFAGAIRDSFNNAMEILNNSRIRYLNIFSDQIESEDLLNAMFSSDISPPVPVMSVSVRESSTVLDPNCL